jgi:predicted outer membrane repeat protein
MQKALATLLFLAIPYFVFSTDVPAGNVSGTWSATESPYVILGDIVIAANTSLIIEPGVDVLFSTNTQLDVYGLINAEGTATDSIRFEAATDNWNGISLHTGISDTVYFSYCRITGMTLTGIVSGNVVTRFTHCRLQDNIEIPGGVLDLNNAKIKINLCNFTNNTPFAIDLSEGTFRCDSTTFLGRSSVKLFCSNDPYIIDCYFDGLNFENNRAIEVEQGCGFTHFEKLEICNFNAEFGAAIYTSAFLAFIEECYIHNNSATGSGGAIFGASLAMLDCTLENNYAGLNGGACAAFGSPMGRNLFINNYAAMDGGAWFGFISPTSSDLTFIGNGAGRNGGAACTGYVHKSIAYNNFASKGGAFCLTPTSNTVPGSIENSLIFNNYADTAGAVFTTGTLRVNHSLIANNLSLHGGAFIAENADSCVFTNTIFWNNRTQGQSINLSLLEADTDLTKYSLRNCLLEGAESSIQIQQEDLLVYQNCIDENPFFVHASEEIGVSEYAELADFRLLQYSPCIDSGIPINLWGAQSDLLLTPRPQGAQVDIGAYEGYVISYLGDFNFDYVLDGADIEMLLDEVGCLNECTMYDLNEDGVVGAADVIVWMGLWIPE